MADIPKRIQEWKDKTRFNIQGRLLPKATEEKNKECGSGYQSTSSNRLVSSNQQYQLGAQQSEENIRYLKLLVSYGDEAAMEKLLEIERTRRRAP